MWTGDATEILRECRNAECSYHYVGMGETVFAGRRAVLGGAAVAEAERLRYHTPWLKCQDAGLGLL